MQNKIILVVDVRNWAFDQIAQYLKGILEPTYHCIIVYTDEFNNITEFLEWLISNHSVQLIHFFHRGYLLNLLIFISKQHSKFIDFFTRTAVTTHIPDHLHIENENEKIKYLPLFNFIDSYFVTSSKLKTLYDNITIYPSPFAVIHDNIPLPDFIFKYYSSTKSNYTLNIAWIGNSQWRTGYEKDYKGLHSIIYPTLKELQKQIPIDVTIFDKSKGAVQKDTVLETLIKTDILLIASIDEGTPLPLLEAMACQCAIITTDVGIAKEILPKIQHQFIIERSSEAFSKAILTLNQSRTLLQNLKDANYLSYQKHFCNKQLFFHAWHNFIQVAIHNSKLEASTKRKYETVIKIRKVYKNLLNHLYLKIENNKTCKMLAKKFLMIRFVSSMIRWLLQKINKNKFRDF